MQVELPFDSFVGIMRATRPDIFDPRKLERTMIFQGLDNGKPHTVYIDEITIDDAPACVGKGSRYYVRISSLRFPKRLAPARAP